MNCFIARKETDAERTVAIDDMILVRDMTCTGGSRMLENWVPLFDAEVVSRLKEAGYEVAGKANVGEFGLDLLGETSFFGAKKDEDGYLTGAGAQIVSKGKADWALNVDLNGTPRRAAALKDVAFIKPTYGTVSRYGIIPCACSAEQIGVTALTAAAAAELLSVIAGHDDKDGTSLPQEKYQYMSAGSVSGLKIGLPKEYLTDADEDTVMRIKKAAARLKEAGAEVSEFSLPEAELASPAWQILLSAETCNNLSRYDGVKFGYRTEEYDSIEELYTKSRTEAFGLLTKFTVLYGSDVLSKNRYFACYDQALRTRRLLREAMDGVFAGYDCLLLPACSKTAYTEQDCGDSLEIVYRESYYTALASILGLPAVADCGVQLVADSLQENKLLTAAECLEKAGMRK